MHIGVDLDDSALDSITPLLSFYNETHGSILQKEDFFSYEFNKVWGGTMEEAIQEVAEFYRSDYSDRIFPMLGAQRALHRLFTDGHKLSAITGRVHSLSEKTEKCIDKYFPNIFSNIYHTNSYSLTGVKLKKSEVCKREKVDIIIDDDLIHIKDCTSADIPVLAYDNPWNQGALPEGSIRVKSWIEILELIRSLSF